MTQKFSSREKALNFTTLAAIFVVVISAVVTQLLAANGAISLSTTLQLTMWLVALGFMVLLAIAYMFFGVYETEAHALKARIEQLEAAVKRLLSRPPDERAKAWPPEREPAEVADWHEAPTGRWGAHDGKADIEQARTLLEQAQDRLAEAQAAKDDAERDARAARERAAEAERHAVRQEARAREATEQALTEAEARLAGEAERDARAARERAAEAERHAVRQEASAREATERLRTAVVEAEARLAGWEARLDTSVRAAVKDIFSCPALVDFEGWLGIEISDAEGARVTLTEDREVPLRPGRRYNLVVAIATQKPSGVASPLRITGGTKDATAEFSVLLDSDDPELRQPAQVLEVPTSGGGASAQFAFEPRASFPPPWLWVRVAQRGRVVQNFELIGTSAGTEG